jgi:hypothetical protein
MVGRYTKEKKKKTMSLKMRHLNICKSFGDVNQLSIVTWWFFPKCGATNSITALYLGKIKVKDIG